MQSNLYSLLEVGQSASAEEIKRSYFRLVRRYPPEKEPEKFRLIRQAYETLSDPRARTQYDSILQHGGEIERLMTLAENLMSKGKWDEAIPLLKKLLILSPEEDSAMNRLGLCYLNSKQISEAIKIFKGLTSRVTDVPVYWYNLGAAFQAKAEGLDQHPSKSQVLKDARTAYQKAIELDPTTAQPYLEIAETFIIEKDYRQAEIWAEKAIGADGRVDMDDLNSIFLLCQICILAKESHKIQGLANRIMSFVPQDEDARKYVASRFIEIAKWMVDNDIYDVAAKLLAAAVKFDPNNPNLVEWKKNVDYTVDVSEQWIKLKDDPNVLGPLKALSVLYVNDYFGHNKNMTKDARSKYVDDVFYSLNQYSKESILHSIQTIRTKYHAIYQLHTAGFNEIEGMAKNTTSRPTTQTQRSSGGGSGDCFVVTATFGTEYSECVQIYRRFRDEHLSKTCMGRLLIAIYNRIGPFLADIVRNNSVIRRRLAVLLEFVSHYLPSK